MSALAPGLAPGLSPGRRLNPQMFAASLINILGATILKLWIGDDVVLTGGKVTSWTDHIVGGVLTPRTSATIITSTLNGRTLLSNSLTATDCTLGGTSSIVPMCVLAGASIFPSPAHNYATVISMHSPVVSREIMKLDINTMNWYTVDGWSHLINGVASETATNAFALYQAVNASAAAVDYDVMGDSQFGAGARNWIGEVGFIMTLSTQPTAGQRDSVLSIVRSYYGF
jgi:hypothetical protein